MTQRELDTIRSIEAIKQLKARYFQTLDFKDWAGFQALFMPDATMDMRDSFRAVDALSGEPRVYGNAQLLAGMDTQAWLFDSAAKIGANAAVVFADVCTVHQGYLPQIELQRENEATGVWAMQDLLRFPPGSPIKEIRGFGYYFETYRRHQGLWRIQSTRLTRLRVDIDS